MTRIIKTLLAVMFLSILLAACGAPADTRSGKLQVIAGENF